MKQILEVSIWGILPILLSIMLFSSMIAIILMKNEELPVREEFFSKKQFHKTEKIFSTVNYWSEIYFGGCVTLALIPLILLFYTENETYVLNMIQNIDVISNIVLGLTAIAITMATVIIVFDKEYYIVFSIREILQKYKISESLIIAVLSCIVVSVITIGILGIEKGSESIEVNFVIFLILLIATLYNILSASYILVVIINIMFFDQKHELSLLEQLYRRFWLYKVETKYFKPKKKWNKAAVRANVKYLVDEYINICKREKIAQIEEIEFVATMDCYKETWYHKARNKFMRMLVSLSIISIGIDIIILQDECLRILILNIMVAAILITFAYSNIQSFQLVIMRFYLDTFGYYVDSSNSKELFIPRVALRLDNIYDKYIKRVNSLNAFFYIWINYVDKKKDIKEEVFKEVIQDMEVLHSDNMVVYFPVFTICFFLFDKGIEIEKLKEICNQTVLVQNKKYQFERMIYSQIAYLTRNSEEDMCQYESRLNEYLQWIYR